MTISTLLCNLPMLLLAIIGISFLIIIHELGHLLFAKLFNVHAPSFSIGFGPEIYQKKIGETTYKLSAIPMGGYVEMAGSAEVGQGEQAFAHDTSERSFAAKPYWQKMLIMFGGILFNIIFAYLALTILAYTGSPCLGTWCNTKAPIINSVVKDKAAEKAGLMAGDKILAVNNAPVATVDELNKALTPFVEKNVTLTIERSGQKKEVNFLVGSQTIQNEKKPQLGVYWNQEPVSFIQSIVEGLKSTWSMICQTFGALKGLTKSREGLGGPLAVIQQMLQCATLGFKVFLFMLAFISVNLAVFNTLPLPIFDGGQALFYTIEAILGRPLSDETRQKIHYFTWIFVLVLLAYLTYKDVFRFLS